MNTDREKDIIRNWSKCDIVQYHHESSGLYIYSEDFDIYNWWVYVYMMISKGDSISVGNSSYL